MTKKPIVFSLVHEQSIFMTAIMALLTFLAVVAFGIALAIGTGVLRWNSQWDLTATVQIMDSKNTDAVKKIIDDNTEKIKTVTEITTEQMHDLLRPWMSGGGTALENYLPKMYELEFNSSDDLKYVEQQIGNNARFLTHAAALHSSVSAGWKMIFISSFVLLLTLGAIGVCISYIARNTALLHRRELEILNQIGATDTYVARQMQIIIAKICTMAGAAGFAVAFNAPLTGTIFAMEEAFRSFSPQIFVSAGRVGMQVGLNAGDILRATGGAYAALTRSRA